MRVPVVGAMMSASTLSVSMDAIASPSVTWSPTAFFHSTSVASTMFMPHFGSTTETGSSMRDVLGGGNDRFLGWNDVVLQHGRERDWDVGDRQPSYGSLQRPEGSLADSGCDLRRHRTGQPSLVHHDRPAGLPH